MALVQTNQEENQQIQQKQGLDALFAPSSVAVIGATSRPGTVGRTVLENLLRDTFRGKVYAVNAKHDEVLGLKTYKSIRDIPHPVDLAVVATPAATVTQIITECVDAGAKSAVVISAGFKERGVEGAALEQQIKEQLKRSSLRLIGPNCLGIMNPTIGLNATFAKDPPQSGNVAFLSQSGALLSAILDWSHREQVGFSAIVSTGSMLDVGWGDLIYYFGDDPHTKSILLYMESVGDARSFLSAAREVALTKPIIVIKAGRSEAASRAAASHTGALTGSDEVLDAAFRRSGVLRVHNIADLFYMAEVLGRQPRPNGPRLTILTNAGGPAVLATDSLVANGGELAELSPETLQRLNEFLPAHWSHNNPIDVLGDADPERYARALEIAAQNPNSDGLLVVLAPQGMTDPLHIAERLKPYAKEYGKPVLASWMGGNSIAEGEAVLNSAGIPTFPFPDTAARAFTYMWRYTYNLRGLYETPALTEISELGDASRKQVEQIINNARTRGRILLTELESKQLLSLYGIPTVETRVASTEDDAAAIASGLGFPVVLKVFSETITHKTDVGGVKLNLQDEAAVRSAYRAIQSSVAEKAGPDQFSGVTVQPMVKLDGYELILGSSLDPQFGPVILFGSGGQLVEVYRDRALALPPLNTTLAQRMMEQTKIFTALKGVRGRKPVDIPALEQLLVRFSQLVLEQRSIAEIDINPLLASPERLLALDARIVLHSPAVALDTLPKPAVRPYPLQYVAQWTMRDGNQVTIRPIRPEDEPLMVKLHETLSDRSVYLRYFCSLSLSRRIAHERLLKICFGDYDREMALVAELTDPATQERRIIAVGRLSKLHSKNEAEVAVLVSDHYQKLGLGHELLRRVIEVARDEKLSQVSAEMLTDNVAMQVVMRRLGFRVRTGEDMTSVRAYLDL
ncbi:MAG TPA: bifunctional acetate--CoA ligase family protein/GNAT family N-acetyltransferase [Candidatus Sulfotelmatobacter sp.]|nr:bifunctional acetate--CoA ligase family protein/GNAT family N-acetyltransferase [Candidatus Sulfotelmatobacter sp.]